MINSLHHISIIVSSEETVSFYKRLGFGETKRIKRESDTVVFLNGYDFELVLFLDPTHPARQAGSEPFGLRQLSFKVDNLDNVARDFDCGPIMEDWVGKKYCVTTDPDGLPIEFHE